MSRDEGFWLSYVDVLTVLMAVFIILYIVVDSDNSGMKKKLDERKQMEEKLKEYEKKLEEYEWANKEIARFSEAWQKAAEKLTKLNANSKPYVDPTSGGWRLEIAEEILFDFESDVLYEKGINKIEEIGKILSDFIRSSPLVQQTIRIVVGGHCDPTGEKDFNLNLSDDRANNVAERLKVKLQGTNVFIEAIGYGFRYLKPNAKKNSEHRRITITIQPIAVKYLK